MYHGAHEGIQRSISGRAFPVGAQNYGGDSVCMSPRQVQKVLKGYTSSKGTCDSSFGFRCNRREVGCWNALGWLVSSEQQAQSLEGIQSTAAHREPGACKYRPRRVRHRQLVPERRGRQATGANRRWRRPGWLAVKRFDFLSLSRWRLALSRPVAVGRLASLTALQERTAGGRALSWPPTATRGCTATQQCEVWWWWPTTDTRWPTPMTG